MPRENHVEEWIPFYLLGGLDAYETEMVEKHLPRCAQCRAVLEDLRGGAQALPYAARPIPPSPRVKRDLFNRVHADLRANSAASQARAIATSANWFDWLRVPSRAVALASLILLVLSIAWALSLRAQVDQLHAQVNEQRVALTLLSKPSTVTKDFQATAVQPNARGQLIADLSDHRALLVVSGLKPLPQGRVYEAWLIKGKTPVGVGTFVVDANGVGQILINAPEPLRVYQIAALTEEPEGGSALPTTSILMSSQFN
ncbi:MAG: anti-sigma factor [Chloroflexi bacterium]|nr:anti-sigma factor [Chloroflexota bacterium]